MGTSLLLYMCVQIEVAQCILSISWTKNWAQSKGSVMLKIYSLFGVFAIISRRSIWMIYRPERLITRCACVYVHWNRSGAVYIWYLVNSQSTKNWGLMKRFSHPQNSFLDISVFAIIFSDSAVVRGQMGSSTMQSLNPLRWNRGM